MARRGCRDDSLGKIMRLFKSMEDPALTVAYNLITCNMAEPLQAPVNELLHKGYGICTFDSTSAHLVREGLFGERAITVFLNEDGKVTTKACALSSLL